MKVCTINIMYFVFDRANRDKEGELVREGQKQGKNSGISAISRVPQMKLVKKDGKQEEKDGDRMGIDLKRHLSSSLRNFKKYVFSIFVLIFER